MLEGLFDRRVFDSHDGRVLRVLLRFEQPVSWKSREDANTNPNACTHQKNDLFGAPSLSPFSPIYPECDVPPGQRSLWVLVLE